MMEKKNVCPGCDRRCDLSAPSCARGEDYARTGVMPERGEPAGPEGPHVSHEHPGPHGPGRHGPHGPHGPHEHPGPHGPEGPGPHGPGPRGHHIDPEQYEKLDTDGKLLVMLHALGHESRRRFDGMAGQGLVLHILEREGTMTQRKLTERLGIQPGSASEVIGKLERAGLVARTPSQADRRTADVRLTEEGRLRRQERQAREQTQRPALFEALTGEEKDTLLALLEKLHAAWTRTPKEHPEHGHGQKERQNDADGPIESQNERSLPPTSPAS